MAKTTLNGIENEILHIKLKVEGKEVTEGYNIQSIKVHHAINKLSYAELEFLAELETASGNIDISDSDDYTLGKKIEIFLGKTDTNLSCVFKGIIVKQSVKIDSMVNLLRIVCKHEAVRMTQNESDNYFENQTDDNVIKNIMDNYGFNCKVGTCVGVKESIVQKNTTDWDFILSLCNFNGFVVTMDNDAGMVLDVPNFSGSSALKIENRNSLLSFEGTIDTEFQPRKVTASAWDPNSLSLISADATEPAVNSQGNISAEELSTNLIQSILNVTSNTPMTEESLKIWANSILMRKRMAAFKGNATFSGNALAKTGNIIEVKGVGKHLSGEAFVSAVTHTIESGIWLTKVDFGLDNPDICVSNHKVSSHLPAMQGLQFATVIGIEQDPENLFRIQLTTTQMNKIWARMAHHYASKNAGTFFLPEIGDEVVLGFLDNDSRFPIVLGSLYNGMNTTPYFPENLNNIKAFVTRSNMKIEFDEEKKNISLLTPSNNSIVISDDSKSIELKDQNGNSIKLSTDGITIHSSSDINILSDHNINFDANFNFNATAKNDIDLKGLYVNANAQVGFTAKGNATAEISAAGETTVKGALVMIN